MLFSSSSSCVCTEMCTSALCWLELQGIRNKEGFVIKSRYLHCSVAESSSLSASLSGHLMQTSRGRGVGWRSDDRAECGKVHIQMSFVVWLLDLSSGKLTFNLEKPKQESSAVNLTENIQNSKMD